MEKRLSLLILGFIIFVIPSYAQETIKSENFWETDSFAIKLTVALISSLISFLVAYFFYRRSKKKEPLKLIAYDLEYSNGLIEIDEKIKEKIKISYKGQPIENISYIKIALENTGNRVIKNQQIRFNLTSNSIIKETFFNPIPERELFTEELEGSNLNEKIIQIGHFEKGQKISFHIVASGEDAKIKLFPFNEEGGVELATRSATKERTDKGNLKRFILILLVLIIVPEIFKYLSFSVFARFILFIAFIKDIITGIDVLVDMVFDNLKEINRRVNTDNYIETNNGEVTITGKKSEKN